VNNAVRETRDMITWHTDAKHCYRFILHLMLGGGGRGKPLFIHLIMSLTLFLCTFIAPILIINMYL